MKSVNVCRNQSEIKMVTFFGPQCTSIQIVLYQVQASPEQQSINSVRNYTDALTLLMLINKGLSAVVDI